MVALDDKSEYHQSQYSSWGEYIVYVEKFMTIQHFKIFLDQSGGQANRKTTTQTNIA